MFLGSVGAVFLRAAEGSWASAAEVRRPRVPGACALLRLTPHVALALRSLTLVDLLSRDAHRFLPQGRKP